MRGCCGRPGSRYGYGTDTTWPPKQSLSRRTARAQPRLLAARHQQDLGRGRRAIDAAAGSVGTLEAGKQADMVLVEGNPLIDINDLLKVMVTIKGGRIVSDTRGKR